MKAKIMFVGDIHRKTKDVTTLAGYCKANDKTIEAIKSAVVSEGITHLISLGDWYDKGYADDVPTALAHTSQDIKLSTLVDGNFYTVIGNHLFLGMETSPELSLIQPHPVLKSSKPIDRDHQVFKTPDKIIIGKTQISLCHFKGDRSDTAESYRRDVEEGCVNHIAVYHTYSVIPPIKMEVHKMYGARNSSQRIKDLVSNVDYAICGHVHKPMGTFRIEETNCVMIVPGSAANVANDHTWHNTIEMPVITINDDDTLALGSKTLNLHANYITKKNVKSVAMDEKLNLLRKNITTGPKGTATSMFIRPGSTYKEYLSDIGCTDIEKQLISSVIRSPRDLSALLSIGGGSIV